MPTDWTANKTTQLTDPFILRRDGLAVVQSEAGSGGGSSVVTKEFSMQTAAVGTSAPWRVPSVTHTIQYVSLSANTAPIGSNLVVAFNKNGVAFATLTMTAGTTTQQALSVSVSCNPGDLITVSASSVGSGTAATGVSAQVDYA